MRLRSAYQAQRAAQAQLQDHVSVHEVGALLDECLHSCAVSAFVCAADEVCLIICLPACLLDCLSVCLPVSVCWSVCLCVCLSVCLFILSKADDVRCSHRPSVVNLHLQSIVVINSLV